MYLLQVTGKIFLHTKVCSDYYVSVIEKEMCHESSAINSKTKSIYYHMPCMHHNDIL